MILQSLRAQNVLKYAHLVISDLPEKGLIAISGHNESGKTAIVETICFALFGRTFSVAGDKLKNIIRWNESDCQVELAFRGNDNETYRIERTLDYKGTHAAQMFRGKEEQAFVSGPTSVEEAVYKVGGFDFFQYLDALYLAQREISSPHSQSETIKAIAGATDLEDIMVELDRDIDSETRQIKDLDADTQNLHANIETLDVAAQTLQDIEQERDNNAERIRTTEQTIESLERTADDILAACPQVQLAGKTMATAQLDTSLSQWSDMIQDLDTQVAQMRHACNQVEAGSESCSDHSGLSQQITELRRRLDAFETVQDRMSSYRTQLATLLGEDGADLDELNTEKPLPQQNKEVRREVRKCRFKNILIQTLIFAGAALSLSSLLAWWQININPETSTAQWFIEQLTPLFGNWSESHLVYLQGAAIVFGGITVFLIILAAKGAHRMRRLKQRQRELQDRLDDIQARAQLIDTASTLPIPELLERLDKLNNDGISQLLKTYAEGKGLPFTNRQALATEQDKLLDMLNACMNSVGDLRKSIATDIGRHQRILEESRERNDELNTRQDTIHQNEDEISQLKTRIDEMAAQKTRHQEQLEITKLAQRLLSDTCRNIYNRFNQILGKYTGMVMPKLTDNRYKQMQIADDLSVRVFSQEKNDFGELEEFSSGTQRQMLLAVRLAMSKALIEAIEQGRQFIILDEPFAFFDRERIRATLAALPDVDKRLEQIWIISQEFDDIQPFSLHIECSRDNEELIIGQPNP